MALIVPRLQAVTTLMLPPAAIPLNSVFLVWITVFAALHFYVTFTYKRRFGAAMVVKNVLIALSWLSLAACLCASLWKDVMQQRYRAATTPGYVTLITQPAQYAVPALKIFFSNIVIYLAVLYMVKFAFIAMYFDVGSEALRKRFQIALFCTTAYVAGAFIASFIVTFTICMPVQRTWAIDESYCHPMQLRGYSDITTVLNITSDLAVILLPILIIRSLTLSRGDIMAFRFLVFLGLLTVSATTARRIYMRTLVALPVEEELVTPGFLASHILVCETWSFAEATAAIMAICLPSLRIYLRTLKQVDRSSGEDSGFGNGHSAVKGSTDDAVLQMERASDIELLGVIPEPLEGGWGDNDRTG